PWVRCWQTGPILSLWTCSLSRMARALARGLSLPPLRSFVTTQTSASTATGSLGFFSANSRNFGAALSGLGYFSSKTLFRSSSVLPFCMVSWNAFMASSCSLTSALYCSWGVSGLALGLSSPHAGSASSRTSTPPTVRLMSSSPWEKGTPRRPHGRDKGVVPAPAVPARRPGHALSLPALLRALRRLLLGRLHQLLNRLVEGLFAG